MLEGQGPILHARWVRHADCHTESLFLTAHHLVVDGWSTPVITGDLMAPLSDAEAQLPALPMPYGTLVRQLAARDVQVCVSAWAERLEEVSPTLLFAEQPDNGPVATLTRTLSTAQEQAVNQLCRRYGLTLNTVMQGIWGCCWLSSPATMTWCLALRGFRPHGVCRST
ncbi:MAG: hypothetical protein G5701_05935 [Serratia symbiotica]|nr:hypothetical protein [Serratia symbiotica]